MSLGGQPTAGLPDSLWTVFWGFGGVGVYFDDGAVGGIGFYLEVDDAFCGQSRQHSGEYSVLGPAVHPFVDGVPLAVGLWQASPFAAVLGYVQQSVESVEV